MFRAVIHGALLGCLSLAVPWPGLADGRKLDYLDPARAPAPGWRKPSEAVIRLGESLFFDTLLSGDQTLSCATCHKPELAFTDGKKMAVGRGGLALRRHTPSLANVAWGDAFFWDGRADTLEEQALMPIADTNEMNLTHAELLARLAGHAEYPQQFRDAFGNKTIELEMVAKAIAAYERTIICTDSPFDRYVKGEDGALSESAKRGLELFKGTKATCITCHDGPNFTDEEFHNTGVVTDDLGRHEIDRIGRREFDMVPYPFFATLRAFKTPTLRNVANTAPYFHDGQKATLEEVVEFYNQGGANPDKTGLARGIRSLNLTTQEKQDLVEFLKSLSAPLRFYFSRTNPRP